VNTNAIGNRGVVLYEQGGSVSGNSSATLSGSIPYLCFTTIVQCNDLTYLKEYSVRQTILYKLIRHLYEKEGMGYRKISAWMNRSGILSERGKKFSNAIVQSILKRKKERDTRISTLRKKKYDFILKDMRIEYFNHS